MAYNSALLSHVLAVALPVLGALQAPPRVGTGSVVVLGISLWIVLHYSSTWPLGPGGRGRPGGRGGEVVNEVRISARDVCVVNRNDTFHNWRGSLVGGVSCFQGAFSKSSLLLFCSSLCPSLWCIRGPSVSFLFFSRFARTCGIAESAGEVRIALSATNCFAEESRNATHGLTSTVKFI